VSVGVAVEPMIWQEADVGKSRCFVDITGGVMLPIAVKLLVTASVPRECEFWTEDDGWKGACVDLSVTVHGTNFEEARKNMETALQTSLESALRDRKMAA
jgi:predicted RNase H-like HicB family nuclease